MLDESDLPITGGVDLRAIAVDSALLVAGIARVVGGGDPPQGLNSGQAHYKMAPRVGAAYVPVPPAGDYCYVWLFEISGGRRVCPAAYRTTVAASLRQALLLVPVRLAFRRVSPGEPAGIPHGWESRR